MAKKTAGRGTKGRRHAGTKGKAAAASPASAISHQTSAIAPSGGAPSAFERVAVERINPAPYNPRRDLRPGDAEYEKLRRSIDRFGLVEPLVWNRRTGHLVGGHQRLKILIARGDAAVDVSVVDLSPVEEKALNIALNKISGDWDPRKLADLLSEIRMDQELDVALTGYEEDEIDQLLQDATAQLGGVPGAEDEPVPAAAGVEIREAWGVLVSCNGRDDQQKVYEAMKAQGYKVKLLSL